MDSENISLLFSTYTVGKVIAVGPGYGPDLALSERSFDGAMALMTTDSGGFHMSTRNHVWSFDSFLRPGRVYCKGRVFPAESEQAKGTDKKWDRVLIPRACHVAGGIDTHDLVEGKNKQLQAVITKFNCVADLDRSGNFSPVWAPKWISSLSFGDRCHLNGLCTNNSNKLAFATSVGTSDEVEGWRKERLEGGVVINIPQNKVICSGLSMPHSPRWHQNTLYVLEGGSGWFGFIDQKTGTFRRVCWCPGFLRGLRFHGKYAFIGLSRPRHEVFRDLPIGQELSARNQKPMCGICVVDLETGKLAHTLQLSEAITEIYDVGVLEETKAPLLIGLHSPEVGTMLRIGDNKTKISS